jgi:lipopolysaccharide transport system ATP-binding protein
LPLSEGDYTLTVFLESNREVLDWIEHAATLTVLDGDFFGTGRAFAGAWRGVTVMTDHDWRVD